MMDRLKQCRFEVYEDNFKWPVISHLEQNIYLVAAGQDEILTEICLGAKDLTYLELTAGNTILELQSQC